MSFAQENTSIPTSDLYSEGKFVCPEDIEKCIFQLQLYRNFRTEVQRPEGKRVFHVRWE
jgi:hypothetical protein